MKRTRSGPAFLRPAILEAILLVTGAAVGSFSIAAGGRIGCTALVEFGMVSAIAAASAGALFARYAVEVFGVVANYRVFEHWGDRLTAAGYIVLGIYAFTNGLLDLVVPRHDPDWVSYPGLATAAFATIVTLLVRGSKYRILEHLASRSLFESLTDDAGLVARASRCRARAAWLLRIR